MSNVDWVPELAVALDRLVPADDGLQADWGDVIARVHPAESTAKRLVRRTASLRRMPTRVALVAAVLVFAAAVTAVAFGLPQTLIDFFTSPPAPTKIKNSFGADNVTAPPGMNPQAIPGQARKIMTARFDENGGPTNHQSLHTLYVAPRKGGGFCDQWTNADGGCAPAKNPETTAESRAAGPLGLTWSGNDYPLFVDGFVRAGATKTVEARFADGATAPIRITWVSAPINAGFFVYNVPPAHRSRAKALRSVIALDTNGKVIGRESFPLTKSVYQDVPQTLPDGTKIFMLPRGADAAKARKIISFRATDGSEAYLWVMPYTGGGDCFVFNQGGGCRIPGFDKGEPALAANLAPGAARILFFGQTKPQVATVELRYQNGATERLTPTDGFILHEITPAHYKRGTRLAAAVALNRSGKRIATQRFRPQEIAVYPCRKPIKRGYGVKACP